MIENDTWQARRGESIGRLSKVEIRNGQCGLNVHVCCLQLSLVIVQETERLHLETGKRKSGKSHQVSAVKV